MIIRRERSGEESAIHALTQAAFAPQTFSDGTEGAIIDALRKAGDLALSLVAENDGEIIGHVAFSPVKISAASGDWYGLGPISVRKDKQRQGIGRGLIEAGITEISQWGAAGCALTGNPEIYQRIGFLSDGTLHHKGADDRYVLWRIINGTAPTGKLVFAPAFDDAQ